MVRKGFSVTELVVAMGVGAVAVGVIGTTLQRARTQTRLELCRRNIRTLQTNMDESGGETPASWQGRLLLKAKQLRRLEGRGINRNTWVCPANERLAANVNLLWEVSERPNLGRSDTLPLGYFGIPGPSIQGTHSPRTQTSMGPASESLTEFTTNPSRNARIVDYVVSDDDGQVFSNISRRAWIRVNDTTNHLNGQGRPQGGNIGFADGHVAWRPFDQMQMQATPPPSDGNTPPTMHNLPFRWWW